MYYDIDVLNEEVINLPNGRLIFKRVDKDLLRITKEVNGYLTSKFLGVKEGATLSLRPLPPSGITVNVSYLLIKLPEPLALLPRSSVTLETKIPVDLGVYVEGSLMDLIPLGRVKYALYGPSDLGDLCRYVSQEIVNATSPKALGTIKIGINSALNEKLDIYRVVIPTNGLITYLTYDDEVLFNVVDVRVFSRTRVEVRTRNYPSVSVERFKYQSSGGESIYTMNYGV